jgi:hypothetical protein
LVDGTKVADDWTDLTDGTLDAPINKGSSGGTTPGYEVWTGSNAAGGLLGNTCVNWTTGAGWGHFGLGDSTTATWTDSFVAPCTELRGLYCIEQ